MKLSRHKTQHIVYMRGWKKKKEIKMPMMTSLLCVECEQTLNSIPATSVSRQVRDSRSLSKHSIPFSAYTEGMKIDFIMLRSIYQNLTNAPAHSTHVDFHAFTSSEAALEHPAAQQTMFHVLVHSLLRMCDMNIY